MTRKTKKRVLLVEDEPLVNQLIEDMLDELGYETLRAPTDLSSATEMAKSERFDLAILDMVIDDGNTFSIAGLLDARKVPFIFVTGLDTSKVGDKLGGLIVLKKPFGAAALDAALQRIA